MVKKLLPALFVLSLVACAPTKTLEAVKEDSDISSSAMEFDQGKANETITFIGKSSIVDHPGHFMKFKISVKPEETTAETFVNATVNATIDLTSAMTDSKGLDGHLQRDDFFDTANFPEAVFMSKSITKNTDGTYAIAGDMTLKGKTMPATFTATMKDNVMMAHYDLPRRDFGVGNDSYGNKLLEPLVPVDVTFMLDQ